MCELINNIWTTDTKVTEAFAGHRNNIIETYIIWKNNTDDEKAPYAEARACVEHCLKALVVKYFEVSKFFKEDYYKLKDRGFFKDPFPGTFGAKSCLYLLVGNTKVFTRELKQTIDEIIDLGNDHLHDKKIIEGRAVQNIDSKLYTIVNCFFTDQDDPDWFKNHISPTHDVLHRFVEKNAGKTQNIVAKEGSKIIEALKTSKDNLSIEIADFVSSATKGEKEKQERKRQRAKRIFVVSLVSLCFLTAICFLFISSTFKTNKSGTPTDSTSSFTYHTPVSPSNIKESELKNEKPDGNGIAHQQPTVVKEDYGAYLNAKEKVDVSVLILNENKEIESSLSDEVAKIYGKTGKTGNIGLLKSSFINRQEFKDLCDGNSEIIENLKLNTYANYMALGKINYSSRQGTLVNGTIVCNASITMNIISTASKTIVQSFSIDNVSGNGVSESQAKEEALRNLLSKYAEKHSSLKLIP